jgi:molybdopterin molybdotransferase
VQAIPYAEALALVLGHSRPLPAESVPFDALPGRVLAGAVRAGADEPPAPKSAMDGYALRAAETRAATSAAPVAFRCERVVGAGPLRADPGADAAAAAGPPGPGEAVRIMTGAWLPPGLDAVVKQEDTRALPDGRVAVTAPLAPGENVIARGAILPAGRLLLEAGAVVTAQGLGLLAGQGHAAYPAVRRPRVGLLALGDELVEPGQPLAPGQLYVSNLYVLEALCRRYGAEPRRLGIVGDDLGRIEAVVRGALEDDGPHAPCDVVVTLGGSHHGDFDFAHAVLERVGATLHFRGVRVNFGGSTLFATRGDALCFGLPGTPMAAWLAFEVLVRPALWRRAGRTRLERPRLSLPLAERMQVRPGRANFIPARIETDGPAGPRVVPLGRGSTLALPPSVLANGIIHWPGDAEALEPGTLVPVELLGDE